MRIGRRRRQGGGRGWISEWRRCAPSVRKTRPQGSSQRPSTVHQLLPSFLGKANEKQHLFSLSIYCAIQSAVSGREKRVRPPSHIHPTTLIIISYSQKKKKSLFSPVFITFDSCSMLIFLDHHDGQHPLRPIDDEILLTQTFSDRHTLSCPILIAMYPPPPRLLE
jgi:hypothetical protein